MRIGTKILLLMLLITAGSSIVITWIATLTVTRYETKRVNDQIAQAIDRYLRQLESRQQWNSRVVRATLGNSHVRSLLQSADDPNLVQVYGRDMQPDLASRDISPAFLVLVSQDHKVMMTFAGEDSKLEASLAAGKFNWPVDAVLDDASDTENPRPVIQYLTTPQGLFLTMGVPLQAQLDEPPSHAYFIGFRVDDRWVGSQLLADQTPAGSIAAPLSAWFLVDGKVVACGSADPADVCCQSFGPGTVIRPAADNAAGSASGRVEFTLDGEHYLGQSFNVGRAGEPASRLVLGTSLDRALVPLRHLQKVILLVALATCVLAFIACRLIASWVVRPIRELVAGTQRIAAGRFDTPVPTGRRDELGKLAESFNQMSEGLKERDVLREERVKIERDMSVARKIQRDILPKQLPPCPGYDLAAFSLPAEATGGDIYDAVTLAPGSPDLSLPTDAPPVVLLLADATGHGIGPALSVTQVRSMLRIGVRLRAGLEAVFSQINRQLCQDLDSGRFVTAFLGLLDPLKHRIDYHSAGQGPLLHFHYATGQFEWLDCSMLPLGVDEDAMSDGVKTMSLAPSDLVVLLTDGFYEYRSANDQDMFGSERVAEVVLRHRDLPASALLNEILAAIRDFGQDAPQLDDMTALIIKRLPETK